MFQTLNQHKQFRSITSFLNSYLYVIWHCKQLMSVSPASQKTKMHHNRKLRGAWWTSQNKRDPNAYSSNSSRIYSMICPTELWLCKLSETKTIMKLSCLNRQCNSTDQDKKRCKIPYCCWLHIMAPGGYMKLLPATASRSPGRWESEEEATHIWTELKAPNGCKSSFLPGFLHSFFFSLVRSDRKCCSGLSARDQGGRRRWRRRRSSAPPASTI